MKKTMRFLSMAALALVGAVMTGCSSDDNFIEQQPENSGKVTTLKTTISFDDGATTRALTSGGVKTFAVGDQVAIVFEDGKSRTWTALSNALTAGDIRNSGKTADITVDIFSQLGTTQANNGAVRLIYPANMAKTFSGTSDAINNDNTIDFTKLNAQDGTLDNLGSSLDLCTFDGNFTAIGELPTSITLTNKLAVCALTLKDNATPTANTITSGLTEVTVSDGSNTYTVAPTSGTFGEDVIYVAIRPVTAALEYTATDGTNNYTKTATSREYAAGNFYNLGLRMAAPAATGHALSASQVGEIVCSDGLAYAAADKDNLPTGVTAVAIVAYLGDGDTSDNTYNNGLAIAMTNANDGSGCGWGEYFASYNCVSKSNDIATAIGYKDGISSTNTLTSDDHSGHYHEAATAAASNNGTAAPTGTSGWFLPSMGQWNLIVQGLASKKAGSAVTTDISTSGNDTYTASNLNSVITDAGGTGFNGDYHSSTQYDSESCWHMCISSGRASDYYFYAGDYVRSVLAF